MEPDGTAPEGDFESAWDPEPGALAVFLFVRLEEAELLVRREREELEVECDPAATKILRERPATSFELCSLFHLRIW